MLHIIQVQFLNIPCHTMLDGSFIGSYLLTSYFQVVGGRYDNTNTIIEQVGGLFQTCKKYTLELCLWDSAFYC